MLKGYIQMRLASSNLEKSLEAPLGSPVRLRKQTEPIKPKRNRKIGIRRHKSLSPRKTRSKHNKSASCASHTHADDLNISKTKSNNIINQCTPVSSSRVAPAYRKVRKTKKSSNSCQYGPAIPKGAPSSHRKSSQSFINKPVVSEWRPLKIRERNFGKILLRGSCSVDYLWNSIKSPIVIPESIQPVFHYAYSRMLAYS